jgi:RNA polymerase sigma factor (sigma-70 family)
VRRRRRPHTIEEPRSSFQTEVADRVDLQRLLGSLSGRQRDVVVLRYLADMSEADVADELGISVGTVKTHASRGVEALRHHLASDKQPESDLDDRKEHTDV